MGQQNQEQPAQSQSQQRKGPAALALSCISASAAELATYPIDAIKTQLQLKHSTAPTAFGSSTKPAGALQLARRLVLQGNGLSGLYAGLTPAVLRHFIYTGTRVTLYEHLKTAYAAHQQAQAQALLPSSSSSSSSSIAQNGPVNPQAAPAGAPVWAGLLFALTAGAVGQLVAVPADLIKVQMQADVRAVMSGQQQHRHFSSIRSVAAALIQQHGVAGLWRGGLPAVQRAALVNLGELSTYDSVKQSITQSQLLPPGLPTHLAASICSGFVSAVISTPVDVLKTRLMAQAVAAPGIHTLGHAAGAQEQGKHPGGLQSSQHSSSTAGSDKHSSRGASGNSKTRSSAPSSSRYGGSTHYRGMVDCAVQTVRQEGLWAMYKGFWPTWARLGPWQLVFWVTYEQLRSLAEIKDF